MTVSKIFKNKYFIFTMCIFIVFAAWGTVVFHAADDTDGTHFFAVKILCFFNSKPPHSLTEKRPPEFVAWINYSSFVMQNTFEHFVNTMFIKSGADFNIVCIIGQAFRNIMPDSDKKIYFLRI